MFEFLFILVALATLVALVAAGLSAVRGKREKGMRTLRRAGIGVAVYLLVVTAASLVIPQRVFHVGDVQCFDDWCIEVASAQWATSAPDTLYDVSLKLSNRAARTPMGEKGTVVYLTDSTGRRYDPRPRAEDAPFSTRLQPGQSLVATRRFDVPRNADRLSLVYTHEGGFPIDWVIVGAGGWFQGPPIVRLY